jgi:hypothetical protein
MNAVGGKDSVGGGLSLTIGLWGFKIPIGHGVPNLFPSSVFERLVIADTLTCNANMQRVMKVVVPVSFKEPTARLLDHQISSVGRVFGDEMDVPADDLLADCLSDLLENMDIAAIFNLINGIEPKAVQPEIAQPIEYILGEIGANLGLFIRNRIPTALMRFGGRNQGRIGRGSFLQVRSDCRRRQGTPSCLVHGQHRLEL